MLRHVAPSLSPLALRLLDTKRTVGKRKCGLTPVLYRVTADVINGIDGIDADADAAVHGQAYVRAQAAANIGASATKKTRVW